VRDGRVVVTALVTGVVAGALLDVLTFVVARYGPSGSSDGASWSFRGNGALVVPFGLGPAVLAGGWAALVRHFRGAAGWLRWGIGAGLAGTLLTIASAAAIALPGPTAIAASQILFLVVLAWTLVAPILAALFPATTERIRGGTLLHVLAAALLAVGLFASFSLTAGVLPPGS
jgi:hypothetical protein